MCNSYEYIPPSTKLKKLNCELELTNEEIGEYIKIVTEYIA